jgi:DNA-binding Lrp family transcriptional regulator
LSTEDEHANNNDKEKDRIDWRRGKVQQLNSQGYSQREIAQILQISNGTVNRDLSYLRQQGKTNIKKYIDERLPEEYEKCLVGLTAILREAWNTAENTEDKREKIQALSLAKECYSMKLDLLTNATVVDDAIRFVSEKSKEKLKSSIGEDGKDQKEKEANKPGHEDEERYQLEEEEQEEEKETEEIDDMTTTTTRTMNHVF